MPFPIVALVIAVASIALNVISALIRPRQKDRPDKDWDIQTATEGRVIPIVWGRDLQEAPNIIWWGDRREVRRNNIWRYFVGLAWGLAHGDARLRAILVNDRVIWTGNLSNGQTLFLDRSTIFGQAGGGVVLDLKYYSGSGASPTVDPYLQHFIADYPDHRRLAYLVSRGPKEWTSSSNWKGYIGNSPSLPQFAFELERCPSALSAPTSTPGANVVTLTNSTLPGAGTHTNDFWDAYTITSTGGWDDTNKWLEIITPPYDPSGVSRFWAKPGNPHLGDHTGLLTIKFEIFTQQLPVFACCSYLLSLTRSVPGGVITYEIPNNDLVAGGWATIEVPLTTAAGWITGDRGSPPASQSHINTVVGDLTSIEIWVGGNRANNTVRLRNFEFNPSGPPPSPSGCIGGDANPVWVLYEALTDSVWGAGIDPADAYEGINQTSFIDAAQVVFDEGLGMSHIQQESIQIARFVESILRHIDAVLYREPTSGEWTLKLVRDDYDPAALFVLDEQSVVEVEEFGADTTAALRDVVRIRFRDRTKQYKESVATFRNPAVRALQGYSSSVDLDFPYVRDPGVAQRIAERESLTYSHPLRRLRATCTRAAAHLRPGDVFRFVWGGYNVDVIMRVTSLRLGSPSDGAVEVEAVEDKFAVAGGMVGAPPGAGSDPGGDDPSATVDLEALRMDELPLVWFGGPQSPRISAMALRSVSTQTGYSLDLAVSPAPLAQVQSGRSFALRTTTATALGGYEPDGHDLLVVTSTTAWAGLAAKTTAQLRQGHYLAYIGTGADAELVAFESVTPVAGGLQLNGLRHGLLDTTPRAWAAGTPIWLVDVADGEHFTVDWTASGVVNGRARSEAGSAVQLPPEGVTASLTVAATHRRQRALAPRNLRVNGVYRGDAAAGYVHLQFIERNRFSEFQVIFQSDAGVNAPEPGGLVRLRIYDETDVLCGTITGISGPDFWISESYIMESIGYLPEWFTIEIHGTVGTAFESWQPQRIRVEYIT